MNQSRTVLVVGAHSADFVWRAAGVIATVTARGGKASVVALSYGERGESGDLWKEPGQTIEQVKRIRHAEATRAAEVIGATFQCFDLGDYPLQVDAQAMARLTNLIRELAPNVIITHTERDPFNPDHPVASAVVQRASILASGSGVASGFPTIKPAELFLFEPHQPEHCGFIPTTFVDITAVFSLKQQAMEVIAAQSYLHQYQTEVAKYRANHARRISGRTDILYAEAFQRVTPQVIETL
ncbi:MAG TPA: PIG-L deacetylase family protein [Ktedonobacterales bacterium]|jgi:4-oxalomesaconate hydratase